MDPFIFLGACAIGAVLPFLMRRTRHLIIAFNTWRIAILTSGVLLGTSAFVPELRHTSDLWHIDAAAGMMLMLIAFIQWTAVAVSVRQLTEEMHEGVITHARFQQYAALFALFVFSMSVTAISNNLGVLWVALEATTLATTFLVSFYAQQGSIEAAWKYLILCSTGITLALIGLLITFYAAQTAGVEEAGLLWTNLLAQGTTLSPFLMQLAFIFILIGYGTKAGLVPLHAWLPDAHGTAPAPISALLSSVLLPVAFLAILRFKSIVDLSLGDPTWTGTLLVVFGLISICIPAFFILVQQDYKRLLAYSSIEHMGLIALAFGLGGVAAVAGMIHLAGHALVKSALFFGAGAILLRFKSTKFARVHAVGNVLPYTAVFFLIGLLALLAVPPSPLFLSEYLLVAVGLRSHPVIMALVLIALTITAAGFIRLCMPFLFAREGGRAEAVPPKEGELIANVAAPLVHYAMIAALGVLLWTSYGFDVAGQIARSI